MKKIIDIFFKAILSYLTIAFIVGNPNITQWHWSARFCFLLLVVIISLDDDKKVK